MNRSGSEALEKSDEIVWYFYYFSLEMYFHKENYFNHYMNHIYNLSYLRIFFIKGLFFYKILGNPFVFCSAHTCPKHLGFCFLFFFLGTLDPSSETPPLEVPPPLTVTVTTASSSVLCRLLLRTANNGHHSSLIHWHWQRVLGHRACTLYTLYTGAVPLSIPPRGLGVVGWPRVGCGIFRNSLA